MIILCLSLESTVYIWEAKVNLDTEACHSILAWTFDTYPLKTCLETIWIPQIPWQTQMRHNFLTQHYLKLRRTVKFTGAIFSFSQKLLTPTSHFENISTFVGKKEENAVRSYTIEALVENQCGWGSAGPLPRVHRLEGISHFPSLTEQSLVYHSTHPWPSVLPFLLIWPPSSGILLSIQKKDFTIYALVNQCSVGCCVLIEQDLFRHPCQLRLSPARMRWKLVD